MNRGEMAAIPEPQISNLWNVILRPNVSFRTFVAIAAVIGVIVFLLGFLIALLGGFGVAYLLQSTVFIVLSGIFIGLLVFFWGARYYFRVWEDIRDQFDVSDERYYGLVNPALERTYSVTVIAVAYFIAFAIVVALDIRIGIEMAILVPNWGEFHIFLVAINYLYGLVVLFLVVVGTHCIVQFVLLSIRLTDFPLTNVDTAADGLAPLARFSIFAATSFIGGVILLLIVYRQLLPMVWIEANSSIVLATIAVLILLGISVFIIPQVAIHRTLYNAKQSQIAEFDLKYLDLHSKCRNEEVPPDYLRAELEIINTQRRNLKEVRTWSYDLSELLPLFGSALVSAGLWFQQLIELQVLF